jgi:tRNA(Ile2) C34 agmatinyltransferase TiaS
VIAGMDDKPNIVARVTQWIVRAYPVCPVCQKQMRRSKSVGLTCYYVCDVCKNTAKSRDRLE